MQGLELGAVKVLQSWWTRYFIALVLIFTLHFYYAGYFCQLPISSVAPDWKDEQLGDRIAKLRQGSEPADADPVLNTARLCWITGYRGGYEEAQRLSLWRPPAQALRAWFQEPIWQQMEAVEVGVATNTTNYNRELLEREKTGLWGLLIRCSSGDLCLTPANFPRRNQFPDGQSTKYSGERLVWRQAKFQASTWVLKRDDGYRPHKMVRADTLVDAGEVKLAQVTLWRDQAAQHLLRLCDLQQGLLAYRYSPTTGEFSETDRNLTKLAWGSLSLANYARCCGQESVRQASEKHLRSVITRFGRKLSLPYPNDTSNNNNNSNTIMAGDCLCDAGQAPLGAQALFALAIQNQPQAPADLLDFEAGLRKTLMASRESDGHFTVALEIPEFQAKVSSPEKGLRRPQTPTTPFDDPQNDQPPMALLALSKQLTPSQYQQSLRYYLDRFRHRPTRAAVPWLALACQSKEDLYFLVDWNLGNLPSWDSTEPQLQGGVFNPDRLDYGPTCHTSDAAAQLQALAKAEQMARKSKDGPRSQRYQGSILMLNRYLRQMQIRSVNDLYWLDFASRDVLVGGLHDHIYSGDFETHSTSAALYSWNQWLNDPGE